MSKGKKIRVSININSLIDKLIIVKANDDADDKEFGAKLSEALRQVLESAQKLNV